MEYVHVQSHPCLQSQAYLLNVPIQAMENQDGDPPRLQDASQQLPLARIQKVRLVSSGTMIRKDPMNPMDLTRRSGILASHRILERDKDTFSLNPVAMTIEN